MFMALLVIMIVPFIFAYGPGSRLSGGAHRNLFAKTDTFFGYDLSDRNQKEELTRLAEVGAWIKTGSVPSNRAYVDELAWKRIVELALADRLGIPTPTADQLTSYMGSLPVFEGKEGSFSQKKFAEFQDQFLRCGFPKDALTDAVVERWRLDQLTDALGGAVFFLPATLERAYNAAYTQYSTEAFTLKPTFDASLTVSEDEAKQFFSKNKSRYDMPETREGVVYSLPAEKFISQVSAPTESELQKCFDQNILQFVEWQKKDDKGNISGRTPKPPILAEHREETIKLFKQTKAARMAADIVDTVVSKLYSDKMAPGSQAWSELVHASGLKELSIKSGDPVADEDSLQALSMLSLSGKPFSEAMQTQTDGRFILLTKVIPSHPQEYSAVSSKVKADALDAKRQNENLKVLTAKADGLKKAFKSGHLEAEALKSGFTIIHPETFTMSAPAKIVARRDLNDGILEQLVNAKVGEYISQVNPAEAVVVALQEKKAPIFNPQGDKAQELRSQLEDYYRDMVEFSYLNEYSRVHAR